MSKILVVTSTFNDLITSSLEKGAIDTLVKNQIDRENIDIVHVPGAFELPVAVGKGAKSGRYDAVIAIGCIIRGETPHFDIIANESARGLMNISIETNLPIINGIITTNDVDQALNRAGIKSGNKGSEAGSCAIEMIQALRKIGE